MGFCAIAASLLLVEVTLTKFVSYKVNYHFVYAIVSTVILSSGLAGVFVHLFEAKLAKGNGSWALSAKAAAVFSILLIISLVLFCWIPWDPDGAQSVAAWMTGGPAGWATVFAPLAVYFLLLAIPCFFAGWCLSQTLAMSSRSVMHLYFLDLLAAATGSLLCPVLLEVCGGYGTILCAAGLGLVAWLAYQKASGEPVHKGFAVWTTICFSFASLGLLVYPQWARATYGQDIRTRKADRRFINDLGAIERTYWNAIARIDVCNTAEGRHLESGHKTADQPLLTDRIILVDGSAPTRQLRVDGPIDKDPRLSTCFWTAPYAIGSRITKELVIGAGGGIDILIAKHFKIGQVDAIELNPSTYKHILLGQGDPEGDLYQRALRSSADTTVRIYNAEARHFATTRPPHSYDLIQATAVDTLTAITSGALTLVESYLYTEDAVRDYVRLLSPDGVLSLSHWRTIPPTTSLRMFVTYLDFLDSIGVKEPWRCVVVTASGGWTDAMLKTKPFTEDELKRVRAWARNNGFTLLFDPERKVGLDLHMHPQEDVYALFAFLPREQRNLAINLYRLDIAPVFDDKPYFYNFFPWLQSTPIYLLMLVCGASLILFLLPLARIRKTQISANVLLIAACVALAGFAFLLFEMATIQLFTVLVDGPLYSLASVLVSVLAGYACGCKLAEKLTPSPRTFFVLGLLLALLFMGLYVFLRGLIHAMLPFQLPLRLLVCVSITFLATVPVGVPVSLALSVVRRQGGTLVAWMWGISSASNAVGAMAFGTLAQAMGISASLLVVSALYLAANLGFARAVRR